ncbi:MAG: hypothetical protein ABL958_00185 [Bdellovibrionia bacterium]
MDWTLFCYTPYSVIQYFVARPTLHEECNMLLSAPTWLPDMPLSEYLLYLIITCGLEAPFYMSIRSLSWQKRVAAIFILNIATHPAVTFLWPVFLDKYDFTTAGMILTVETFAPVTEALILIFGFRVKPATAILVAFLANLVSWGLGLYVAV